MKSRYKLTVTVDVIDAPESDGVSDTRIFDEFKEYLARQLGPDPHKEPGDPTLTLVAINMINPLLERQAVSSSNIQAIGYNKEFKILEVEFKGGSVYQYYEVPEQIFNAFLSAESIGKFFHSSIRGIYEYVKVEASAEKSTPVAKNQAELPLED